MSRPKGEDPDFPPLKPRGKPFEPGAANHGNPFQPGESGHPGGIPAEFRFSMGEFKRQCRQRTQAVLDRLYLTAIGSGPQHVRAAELMLAYAFGRPKVQAQISTAPGAPIEIDHRHQIPTRTPTSDDQRRRLVELIQLGGVSTMPATAPVLRAVIDAEEAEDPDDAASGS